MSFWVIFDGRICVLIWDFCDFCRFLTPFFYVFSVISVLMNFVYAPCIYMVFKQIVSFLQIYVFF